MNDTERDKMMMEIHGNVEAIKNLVEIHQRTLQGNGQPGIIRELTALTTNLEKAEKKIDGLEKTSSEQNERIHTLEKNLAVSEGKLDTSKAIIGFLITLVLSIAGIVIGVINR